MNNLLEQGHNLLLQEEFEEGMVIFQKIVEQEPCKPQGYFGVGLTFFRLKQFKEALTTFSNVLEVQSNYIIGLSWRGLVYLELNNPASANIDFLRALEIKPITYEDWQGQGIALGNLNLYEKEILSYDKAIELKNSDYLSWFYRAIALGRLGRYEKAIFSYDKVLEIKPNFYKAWCNRSISFGNLHHHEEALSSCNKALEIKPDHYKALAYRGVILENLHHHEEALASFNKALEIKPDHYEDWLDQGITLSRFGRHEEALSSYDKVIEIRLDNYKAWCNRGICLGNLYRYEEALSSFDKAIELKNSDYLSWFYRGLTLDRLGRYEKAIFSYDKAIMLSEQQHWQSWRNKGLALLKLSQYENALLVLEKGVQAFKPTNQNYYYCCGKLYQCKGDAQYQEGSKRLNPFPEWLEAKENFIQAAKYFDIDKYPQEHLEVWQSLLLVYYQLGNQQAIEKILEEGTAKLHRIQTSPKLSPKQKIPIERQFSGFHQLRVDFLAQRDPLKALVLAEDSKNRCLGHLINSWKYQSDYAQIQTLLTPYTAIIYWHLSPAALTTFILKANQPPQLLHPISPANSAQQFLSPQAAAQIERLQEFEAWMHKWKRNYRSEQDIADHTEEEISKAWRSSMELMLFKELRHLLDINRLCQEHTQDIQQLILIPHRDLHLLPLHALFPERFSITYLPSAQIGINYQWSEISPGSALLNVADPPSYSRVVLS